MLLPCLHMFDMFHSFTSRYFCCHLQVIHFISNDPGVARKTPDAVKCLKPSKILSKDTSKVKVVVIPLCHSASRKKSGCITAEVAEETGKHLHLEITREITLFFVGLDFWGKCLDTVFIAEAWCHLCHLRHLPGIPSIREVSTFENVPSVVLKPPKQSKRNTSTTFFGSSASNIEHCHVLIHRLLCNK